MTEERVAVISVHACPLARLGIGKSGGMNVYIRQVIKHLPGLGFGVDVFTLRDECGHPDIVSLDRDVRIVHLEPNSKSIQSLNITDMPRLHTLLPDFLASLLEFQENDRQCYTLVHTHYWLSGLVGFRFAQYLGIRMVASFHTLAELKRLALTGEESPSPRYESERQIMAEADLLIAFSQHERIAMSKLYGADLSKIQIVPCGVDLSLFHQKDQNDARQILGLDQDAQIIINVSRIEPLKGIEMLLRALSVVEHQKLKLLILGGDPDGQPEAQRLQSIVHRLGIQDMVQFVGAVDQSLLSVYYSAADICVIPSYYESFGLTALESMACGTPVIAYRTGGLIDLVEHGKTGYLIPWRCPESFANWLEALLCSPSLRRSIGYAAQRWAQTLSWERIAADIALLYRNMDQSGGRSEQEGNWENEVGSKTS